MGNLEQEFRTIAAILGQCVEKSSGAVDILCRERVRRRITVGGPAPHYEADRMAWSTCARGTKRSRIRWQPLSLPLPEKPRTTAEDVNRAKLLPMSLARGLARCRI